MVAAAVVGAAVLAAFVVSLALVASAPVVSDGTGMEQSKSESPAQSSNGKQIPLVSTPSPKTLPPALPTNSNDSVTISLRSLPDVVEQVENAVVRIDVETDDGGSIGSGFVVTTDGVIATNFHVIAGAREAFATFSNGVKVRVQGYLAVAPEKDLVVLKLRSAPRQVTPLLLDTLLPRKGETVFAIGSPNGLDDTVTSGIVSAIRTPGHIEINVLSSQATHIQTTTPISPGNSGGPLFNERGKVVGINTWKHIEAGMDGLNFAVSATDLEQVLKSSTGTVHGFETLPSIAFSESNPAFRDVTGTSEAKKALRSVRRFAVFSQATAEGVNELPHFQDVVSASLTATLRARGHEVTDDPNARSLAVMAVFLVLEPVRGKGIQLRSQAIVLTRTQANEVLIVWQDETARQVSFASSLRNQELIDAIRAQVRGHGERLANELGGS